MIDDMRLLRVAGVLLVDCEGRVLLQHRDQHAPTHPGKWSIIGGGIEGGETPEQAARRELQEETGLIVSHPPQFFHHELVRREVGDTDFIERFNYAAATGARQDDVILGEGDAIEFKTPAEVTVLDIVYDARAIIEAFLASALYTQILADHHNR